MIMRYAPLVMILGIMLTACGPGTLRTGTPTPSETAPPLPSLTVAPTETAVPTATSTNTATATVTAAATWTPRPAALTCPKGTVLRASVNKCFYATRTPKPEHSYCEDFGKAADCRANGCTWIRKTRSCSP
jgi:hypothetical protein